MMADYIRREDARRMIVQRRYDRSSEQFDVVKCSRCGLEAYAMAYHVRDGNYCPRCGAKMDGGDGSAADCICAVC